MQKDVSFLALKKDGDIMLYGQNAFEVKAKVHTILKAERLVLNIMQQIGRAHV